MGIGMQQADEPVEVSSRGNRRCSAKSSRTGEPCRKWAVYGATVCATHGVAKGTPGREAARMRLLAAADPVAAALVKLALDRKQPPAARVSAMRDILDRAGLKLPDVIEHRDVDLATKEDVARKRDELADRRAKKAAGQ